MENPIQTDRKPRVLVVEDNPINVIVLKKFIDHLCEADSVINGAKALEMLANRNYDLILMDINLGNDDMNGIDVLNRIRDDDRWSQIPVIVVTTRLDAPEKEIYAKAGFTDFVSKPINREEVLQVIEKYL